MPTGIYIRTKEHKKNMSKALKGENSSLFGIPLTNKHRQKISNSKRGHSVSKITRRKISKTLKGNIPYNKGVLGVSEKTHLKMSKSAKGKKLSEETKRKIGIKSKRFMNSKEGLKKVLHRRPLSSLEIKFQGIVDKHNLPYYFVGDGSFIIANKNPDFVNINGEKITIEVYARYFKLRHDDSIKDWKRKRAKIFRDFGWKLLFFDETQVNENQILKVLKF